MIKEKIGTVYLITSPSGKFYVGSTSQRVNDRWRIYKKLKCKTQNKLYASLNKYGPENHIFEVIWQGSIEDRLKFERILGEKFNVLDKHKGLNLILPGYDEIPYKYSEESLEKMRLKATGRKIGPMSQEHKDKISLANKGKPKSPEAIIKSALVRKGRVCSNDLKERLRHIAKNPSKTTRDNFLKAIKNRVIKKGPNKGTLMANEILKKKIQCNETKDIFDSIKDAMLFFNISRYSISVSLKNNSKTPKCKLTFKFL